jgi:hypothetical protein
MDSTTKQSHFCHQLTLLHHWLWDHTAVQQTFRCCAVRHVAAYTAVCHHKLLLFAILCVVLIKLLLAVGRTLPLSYPLVPTATALVTLTDTVQRLERSVLSFRQLLLQ